MSPLLTVEDLSVWRGDNLLIDNLSFSLHTGEVLRVGGANGSGKTTLLRTICGIALPDDGAVHWRGKAIDRDRDQYNEELLYLGHKPGIKGALSAMENLRILCTLSGNATLAGDDDALLSALDNVALLPIARLACKHLSAGQQRRVSLARLVLERASLWILDEPLTSLDKNGIQWVEGQIARHVSAGGAVVLTTHAPLQINGVEVGVLELG